MLARRANLPARGIYSTGPIRHADLDGRAVDRALHEHDGPPGLRMERTGLRVAAAGRAGRLAIVVAGCLAAAGCQKPAESIAPPTGRIDEAFERSRFLQSPAGQVGAPAELVDRWFRPPSVQDTAAYSLSRLGPEAVPYLIECLADRDEQVRARAARALARIGPEARQAVSALVVALQDPSQEVRRQAAEALGQIGPEARAAIPALVRVLREPAAGGDTRSYSTETTAQRPSRPSHAP